MAAGGADIIELGMPFTDPIADGPTIQKANAVALANGVTVASCLQMVKDSRKMGLRVPVLLMGYYNPIFNYGEERMVRDSRTAGVNGFIIVDLPPEEATSFRKYCAAGRLSIIPLIAPVTGDERLKVLCEMADSFIYVVSRMGVTGATGSLNTVLPEMLERVHRYSDDVPAAVGFGVSTREHYLSVQNIAEGVVIGSQIVTILGRAPPGQGAAAVQHYCSEITHRQVDATSGPVKDDWEKELDGGHLEQNAPSIVPKDLTEEPSPFGQFGGQYVPESLIGCLNELEICWNKAKGDPEFWKKYHSYYLYMARPSPLFLKLSNLNR